MFRKLLKYALVFVLFVVVLDPALRQYAGPSYDRAVHKLRDFAAEAWALINTTPTPAKANNDTPNRLVIPIGLDEKHTRKAVVRKAMSLVGTRYRFGGESRTGVDCSGLVVVSYREVGVELPHKAQWQYKALHPVEFKQLRSGDLVFFGNKTRRIGHVGVYLGNGMVAHASSSRQRVVVEPMYVVAMYNRVSGMRTVFPGPRNTDKLKVFSKRNKAW